MIKGEVRAGREANEDNAGRDASEDEDSRGMDDSRMTEKRTKIVEVGMTEKMEDRGKDDGRK